MAATTAGVPAISIEDLMKGKVPGVCSVLAGVPHGNFFAVPLEDSLVVDAKEDLQFIMDARVVHAWDYQLEQGVKYLHKVIQPIGPYGSAAFCEASEEIGIPPDYWLMYLSERMIPHYLAPLTQRAPLTTMLHHANRARDQLLGLYSFISLIRQRTVGKETIFRCPEDNVNWRFHALYCQAGICPRMEVPLRADEANPYRDPAQEEGGSLARLQLQRVEELDAHCLYLENQLKASQAQNAELSRDLATVTSQHSVLQTELGRTKRALKHVLSRARSAEDVLSVLRATDSRHSGFRISKGTDSSSSSSHSFPLTPSTSSSNISLDVVKKEKADDLEN